MLKEFKATLVNLELLFSIMTSRLKTQEENHLSKNVCDTQKSLNSRGNIYEAKIPS